jgi:ferrous iron transport protein B
MKLALIGNPNVGKSLIFNQLTGLGVEVSNYPGTTVEMESGGLCYRGKILELIDLPGVYSLEGESEEEKIVRRMLQQGEVEVGIMIMDAGHLERNLYLFLQVAEYGLPLIVVLNMIDEAESRGIEVNMPLLEDRLGVPVLPTAASHGRNISQIIPLALSSARPSSLVVPYAQSIEAAVRSLRKAMGAGRQECLQGLQGLGGDPELVAAAELIREEIEEATTMTVAQILAANRHNFSRLIAAETVKKGESPPPRDLDRILTRPFPGVFILIGILLGMLVTVFTLGSVLEEGIVRLFDLFLLAPLESMALPPLAGTVAISVAIALQAGLGIALPYIFLYFLFLSVLEDSGYITRAAFLSDSLMHRIGLHGGGVIPLILGFGCNVPAVMAVRTLRSRRERIIAGFLITMVPCSARTILIMGLVAAFVGIAAAISLYLLVTLLILLTGIFLSRVLPGERFGMITEMAPLRRPDPLFILQKSWNRLREFLFLAIPLLVAGSIGLGLLEYTGGIDWFSGLLAPVSTAMLGLPPYAVAALFFGILRKEMALGTLAVLAGTSNLGLAMTALQLYTFALISVLFIPCISTIAVLSRVVGTRFTVAVTMYTVLLGLTLGAAINLLF